MWVTAMPAATQARTSTAMKDFKLAFLGVPPNELRLSCAAVLCFSQLQFYYDGRRQLQPLVRQPATHGAWPRMSR
jgi:hypothetical protein